MSRSVRTGISFGLTSATITTLGLMVGLNSTTHSQLVVLGGVITIAIADALSDSLGIHISEESRKNDEKTNVWEATFATFGSKLVFGLTFAVPLLLMELDIAVIISVLWGMLALALLSYFIAKSNRENPVHVIGEHIAIAVFVIIVTHFLGAWIGSTFG
ncbi:hypothetical protein JXA56_03390 [Candidatus Micrarchaeota archaeon]|nr:hypothetical protein [Candidatus Micrarchaeota archaeon]